jgi:hypothetical protein
LPKNSLQMLSFMRTIKTYNGWVFHLHPITQLYDGWSFACFKDEFIFHCLRIHYKCYHLWKSLGPIMDEGSILSYHSTFDGWNLHLFRSELKLNILKKSIQMLSFVRITQCTMDEASILILSLNSWWMRLASFTDELIPIAWKFITNIIIYENHSTFKWMTFPTFIHWQRRRYLCKVKWMRAQSPELNGTQVTHSSHLTTPTSARVTDGTDDRTDVAGKEELGRLIAARTLSEA